MEFKPIQFLIRSVRAQFNHHLAHPSEFRDKLFRDLIRSILVRHSEDMHCSSAENGKASAVPALAYPFLYAQHSVGDLEALAKARRCRINTVSNCGCGKSFFFRE